MHRIYLRDAIAIQTSAFPSHVKMFENYQLQSSLYQTAIDIVTIAKDQTNEVEAEAGDDIEAVVGAGDDTEVAVEVEIVSKHLLEARLPITVIESVIQENRYVIEMVTIAARNMIGMTVR